MDLTLYSRRYELRRGSDVGNDTDYIELNDITDGVHQNVLFAERTADGKLHFLSLIHLGPTAAQPILLPLPLVEDFIAYVKQELSGSR